VKTLVKRATYHLEHVKYHLPFKDFSSVIYRKKDTYQLVANDGVYEISFQNKEFTQVLELKRHKTRLLIKHGDTLTVKKINEKNIVSFFPEYTKIEFSETDPSYLILHDNGEITANIGPNIVPGFCLSVRKLSPKEETEIVKFGLDCAPNSTVITYDGVLPDTLFNVSDDFDYNYIEL
jgi:hypothetical protein